jgi:hypothetical protein
MGVCRVKALITAPLPHLWDFLIRPENMHLWGPLTQPVTGINRPLQAGDRVTQWRKDFFRHYCQVLLVEEVIPYRSLRFRDLSPAGLKIDARATISVEEARDREATWIEEAISYSLGSSRTVRWLDCWMVHPVIQLVAGHKTNKAFRRLQALVGQPDKKRETLK